MNIYGTVDLEKSDRDSVTHSIVLSAPIKRASPQQNTCQALVFFPIDS